MCRKARRLALAVAPSLYLSFVLCLQNIKFCECLLAMPSFQCIGGSSVPPPMACRTLGRAAHRKARRLALADALSLYLSFVLCLQNVKFCECLLAMPSFQCIGGDSMPPPMACRTLGRAAHQKARRLPLADAPSLYFSFVVCSQNVKICACLLAMPSFQCGGGGSVPPPMACQTLGRTACREARRLASADASGLYFSFVLCSQKAKSVHVCLQCPIFNASRAAVCRPQCLAGRWAGRRAQWRVAWPCGRQVCKIFVPCRVGKLMKSVSVCLKFAVFNASGAVVCRPTE